jgi:hypothetical protein
MSAWMSSVRVGISSAHLENIEWMPGGDFCADGQSYLADDDDFVKDEYYNPNEELHTTTVDADAYANDTDNIILVTFEIVWILCIVFGLAYFVWAWRKALANLPYNTTRPVQVSLLYLILCYEVGCALVYKTTMSMSLNREKKIFMFLDSHLNNFSLLRS